MIKLQKRVFKIFINQHDRSLVAAPVAVVGSTENSDHVMIMAPVIPIRDKLVSSCDESQVVRMIELQTDINSKSKPSASGRSRPSRPVVRVAPDKVRDGPLSRDVLEPVQSLDFIYFGDFR